MTRPVPREPRVPSRLHRGAAPLAVAAWVTATAVASIYMLQLLAANRVSTPVAFAVSFGATAASVGFLAKRRGFELGFSAAPARFWLAAALIGLSTWYVDLAWVTWLGPGGDTARLEAAVQQTPVAVALIAIAVLPAFAEELVFRGVLARSLARRSTAAGIIGSALAFSLYHLMPMQVVATFPLGLALATLAVRSDSVGPGIVAHFLNNAVVIALSRNALPALADTVERHSGAAFAVALAATSIGVVLAIRKPDHQLPLN